MEYTHICHPFRPIYDEDSEILILGSLPSVKSREQGFYYGHPQNRFWKVMAAVMEEKRGCVCNVPRTIEEKRSFLLANHIAIWDVIASCDIKGSSDSSIKNAVANDISGILAGSRIQQVYANGKTAGRLYMRYIYPDTKREVTVLPSTSPANAAWTLEKLVREWADKIADNIV